MKTYLKPLIKKLTNDKEVINISNSMKSDKEIIEFLCNQGVSFDEITQAIEEQYGVKYISLIDKEINKAIMESFDMESLCNNSIIPYEEDAEAKVYYFVTSEIFNQNLRGMISFSCAKRGYRADFGFAFKHEIEEAYREMKNEKTDKKELDGSSDFDAEGFIENIIDEAINSRASDIHIEALEVGIQVRFRIDGVLTKKQIYKLSASEISNIVVRIKIISSMNIAEKRKPQDGRIDNYYVKKDKNKNKYDLRVSSISTVFGEKFVFRIFNKTSKSLTFEELGFSEVDTSKIENILRNKNGIIYLAGATGSGKTTTLYTMIDNINSDEINIYTIEDPVERTVETINQIQIDNLAGITYPSTLRAILRQDPDVVVVGEIRDGETAELSIRASLTGHLVMTTIHANNAIDSISRLYDMGIEPYLLSASSLAFISQRLVRVLCPHCKAKIEKMKPFEEGWINEVKKENEIKKDITISEMYEPVGCDKCSGGYKGRVAIIEILEVTDKIRGLISQKADLNEIKKVAMQDGFKSLAVNGLDLVLSGKTSMEELMKTI